MFFKNYEVKFFFFYCSQYRYSHQRQFYVCIYEKLLVSEFLLWLKLRQTSVFTLNDTEYYILNQWVLRWILHFYLPPMLFWMMKEISPKSKMGFGLWGSRAKAVKRKTTKSSDSCDKTLKFMQKKNTENKTYNFEKTSLHKKEIIKTYFLHNMI